MYLKPKQADRDRARKDLRGFQRIALQPGEERSVSFSFTPTKDMRVYDEKTDAYSVDPGMYEVEIGASSADIRLSREFTLKAR
jgi:beta-glucosidase